MGRWFRFFLVIALGITLGLLYGWVINPVTYVDTAPDSLKQDYKTDYVLMVAEAYQVEKDVSLAIRRLALLGSDVPEDIIRNAIQFASSPQVQYNEADLALMRALGDAVQNWDPSLEVSPP